MEISKKLIKAISKGLNEALTDTDLDLSNINQKDIISNERINKDYYSQKLQEMFLDPENITLEDVNLAIEWYEKYGIQYLVPNEMGNNFDSIIYDLLHKLVDLGITNFKWIDVSKIDSMHRVFEDCKGIANIDLSNWDTSKVTSMSYMFSGSDFNNNSICNWNISNVEDFREMFGNDFDSDISNWTISEGSDIQFAFDMISFKNLPKNIANDTLISTIEYVKLNYNRYDITSAEYYILGIIKDDIEGKCSMHDFIDNLINKVPYKCIKDYLEKLEK